MLNSDEGHDQCNDLVISADCETHRIEVAGQLKDLLAINAVVMTLSVVFVQTKIVLEQLAAEFAV